ncbi:MAG: sigma-E processing peptidase SpoIIGA [Bacillota bacterium]|nr:sigma-E processing peptidase SpoIIGA [Bacillota bacterium]
MVLESKGLVLMVVYVDVYILENFIVNYFLMTVTTQTLYIRINNKRAVLSSVFAAFYSLIIFVPKLQFMTSIPLKLPVAFLIIQLAYGKTEIILKLKAAALYIVYTFVLAGIIIFLQYRNSNNPAAGLFIGNFTSGSQLTALMIVYIILYRLACYVIDRRKLKTYTYPIEIITKSGSVKVQALLDTGNELREPVTNLPVIIVEKGIISGLDTNKLCRIYIPYKVVNGQANFLEAFKPEVVKVSLDEKHFEYKNAVIGISDAKLSEAGEYQALLSRDII